MITTLLPMLQSAALDPEQQRRLEEMQQQIPEVNPVVAMVMGLVWLVIALVMVVAFWKVFTKAGRPGWASIIPIYQGVVLLQISGKSGWWILSVIFPPLALVLFLLAMIGLAKNFGQGAGFGLGLFFLGFIFFPLLAFGNYQYVGPREA